MRARRGGIKRPPMSFYRISIYKHEGGNQTSGRAELPKSERSKPSSLLRCSEKAGRTRQRKEELAASPDSRQNEM